MTCNPEVEAGGVRGGTGKGGFKVGKGAVDKIKEDMVEDGVIVEIPTGKIMAVVTLAMLKTPNMSGTRRRKRRFNLIQKLRWVKFKKIRYNLRETPSGKLIPN